MSKWGLHERTTEEQARINRGRHNNGTLSKMEDTTPSDDVWDVAVSLAGSGVVYDIARPYVTASRASKCSHGGYDRCICGLDGA